MKHSLQKNLDLFVIFKLMFGKLLVKVENRGDHFIDAKILITSSVNFHKLFKNVSLKKIDTLRYITLRTFQIIQDRNLNS